MNALISTGPDGNKHHKAWRRVLSHALVFVAFGLSTALAAAPQAVQNAQNSPPDASKVVSGSTPKGHALNRPTLEPYSQSGNTPALGLSDLEGGIHTLDAYSGRVLVVNFWATWCPPCREEMPSLNRAAATLRSAGVEFVAVNIGQTAADIRAFLKRYPIEFPVLLDPDQAAVRRWPVIGLPTTVVVAPDRRIAYRVTGDREWDDPVIVKELRRLAANTD